MGARDGRASPNRREAAANAPAPPSPADASRPISPPPRTPDSAPSRSSAATRISSAPSTQERAARYAALRAAIDEALGRADPLERGRKPWLRNAWCRDAIALLREIVATADRLLEAHDRDGASTRGRHVQHELLATIDRIDGCPTFSDLARALRVTRQRARASAIAIAAAQAGVVELLANPYDRRTIQVALTPRGRGLLAAERSREVTSTITLLAGLGTREMHIVGHVLGVIRRRLERNGRERRAQLCRPVRQRRPKA